MKYILINSIKHNNNFYPKGYVFTEEHSIIGSSEFNYLYGIGALIPYKEEKAKEIKKTIKQEPEEIVEISTEPVVTKSKKSKKTETEDSINLG